MEQNTDIIWLLELIPAPAFCVQDGIVTAVNRNAENMRIAAGQPIHELLHTGLQEYRQFREGRLHLTLNAPECSCDASVSRLNGLDIFTVEQDTEHSELQAMALAARELRNPLSTIMTAAENLFPLCGMAEDPAKTEVASHINRGIHQLQRIISNMSDAYRYTAEGDPWLEIRDMGAFWNEFFTRSAELLAHADIQLHYTGISEKLFSLADGEKLERAANNILSNAMKYTPKGGTIEATLTHRDTMLYLTVQDSGFYGPQGIQGNYFDRYLRQPCIEDSRFGIGLGMVLIRSVATMHGGTVLLEQTAEGCMRLTFSIAIRQNTDTFVHNAPLRVDYAGNRDHALIELSEVLPASLYTGDK